MRIINESVEVINPFGDGEIDGGAVLRHLERCARTCYKSEDLITEDSAARFIRGLLKSGHEAAIEHFNITVKIICDRAVQNEIVRHRLASFCVESTRYCNYGKGKFGEEITVIKPCFFEPGTEQYVLWHDAMRQCEDYYLRLLANGATPQEARDVLPLSLKTEVVMTADIREWRHFLRLRTGKAAHPQMRVVANMILEKFKEVFPVIFDDIEAVA